MLCQAFKVVHDTNRGYLVFIRIYSGYYTFSVLISMGMGIHIFNNIMVCIYTIYITGSLSSKQIIFNTTRNTKERINQIVRIDAEDYQQVSEAYTG